MSGASRSGAEGQVSAKFHPALALLIEAFEYAQQTTGDIWEFAVEIQQFRELGTFSDVRVELEQQPLPPPALPQSGLCVPAPAGDHCTKADADRCYCSNCQAERRLVNAGMMKTPNNRPAVTGRCAACGGDLVVSGGALVAGAPTLTAHRIRVTRDISTVTLSPIDTTASPLEPRPVVEIVGVGPTRETQLANAGIETVGQLARAAVDEENPGIDLSVLLELKSKAAMLTSLSIHAEPFGEPTERLIDMLNKTPAELAESSGRPLQEAKQLHRSLRAASKLVDQKAFESLTVKDLP